MRVGMLWFNDSKNLTLQEKVEQAATHYQEKYGVWPDTCHCHPSMLIDQPEIEGITLKASNNVLPHHLWIGVNNQEKTPERIEDNDNLS